MNIKIIYDGEYPCLCGGELQVQVEETLWDFGKWAIFSQGEIQQTEDGDYITIEGDWIVVSWPENFPQELKPLVEEAVNNQIPHGCCGGCI